MQHRITVSFALSLALLTVSAAEGQQLFNNFPVNGQISAFQISGTYSVSNSFTLAASSTIGEIEFGAWLTTGDSVTGVAWSIGTAPFGSSAGSGVAGATSSYNVSNADAFDVDTVSFLIPSLTLPAGTYYLTLSAAVSAGANPVYWDINDGAGINASDSAYGNVSASNTCFQTIGISGTCASSFEILSTNTAVTASPASLAFPNQTVNTTSTAQGITITNNGPGVATISGIAITGTNPGDFAQTNNCPISPATLATNGVCTIAVTFTPLAANARSAAVIVTGSSPQSIGLSGTGTLVPSTVTFLPTAVNFPNQTLGTTSGSQGITVTNSGPSPLTISSIAVTGTNPGDFAQTNNCPLSPTTVPVNGFCTINVTFTPAAANARSAAITITDNGAASPQSVGLSGTGTIVPSTVTLAPTSISFPNQIVNTTSTARAITVTNSGPSPLTISGIAVTGTNPGDFAQTNNCPVSPTAIAVNGFCTINVTFTPAAANARSAAITITDNGASSPQSVGLGGTGLPVPSTVTLAPTSIGFPNQTVNTTSGAQAITLTNSGPNPLTISSIAVTGTNPGDFAQTNNCPVSPTTIAVNGFCTINVTFTPTAANARTAAITITDNGAASPQSAGLSGTGTAAIGPQPWPNGYSYQATFTVAANQVPSTQTNFPSLISGTFADFATTANGGRISNTCAQTVGNNATSVPCDLIFTSDAAGTILLNWEFETWAPTTGAANIWVNAPNLANGTIIYAWYGQPSVTTLQTTPSATWGSNFMAVYHLKENPAGTAPQMNDSTANGNNATMNGTVLATQQQPGEIDGSVNFEGNTWASLANPANFSFERTDSFSISGWFNIALNSAGTLLSKYPNLGAGWAVMQFQGSSRPSFALGLFGTGSSTFALAETPAVTTGAWHHVVATYSGTGTVAGMNIYVDGVNQTLTTFGNNLSTSILNTGTPAINGRGGPAQMSTDSMDELRVSTKGVVFSSAWVTASYNNQSRPGTFFTAVTGLTNP